MMDNKVIRNDLINFGDIDELYGVSTFVLGKDIWRFN